MSIVASANHLTNILMNLKVQISRVCQAHFELRSRIPGTESICGGLAMSEEENENFTFL